MKKCYSRLLSALLACALLSSVFCVTAFGADTGEFDPPDNLIRNPGFEDGADQWEICPKMEGAWFNTSIGQYTDFTHSGAYSAMLGSHAGDWGYIYQDIENPGEAYYELSAYVRFIDEIPEGTPIYMSIESLDGEQLFSMDFNFTDSLEWQRICLPVELGACPEFRVSFASQLNLVMIDDVALVPTEPPAPPEPEPEQILRNGGFENTLSGWTQQGTPNAFTTDAQSRTGSSSLYLGYFQNEPLVNYVEQSRTSGGGTYDFTVWVKTDQSLSGIGAALFLEARDANGKVLAVSTSSAVNDSKGEWTQLSVRLTAPASTKTVVAKIGGVYCTGAFYADDAQLMYLNSY